MYEKYFGITTKPFSIAPDPEFLYMSDGHREALAHLRYGLESEGGFVLLTGEVGTGKTTVCRCLLEQVPDDAEIAFIINPKVTVIELLESICDELAISRPAESASVKKLVDLVNEHLLQTHADGRRTVLIIDEAQNLDSDVLEQIRLLTNLETNRQKLLQIILLGQPELQKKLNSPKLRQLGQRIAARHHLGPLSKADTSAYIVHRLSVSGMNRQVFSDESVAKLFQLSGGTPRLINMIGDRALLGAYVKEQQQVDKKMVAQAAREVFGEKYRGASSFAPIPVWKVIVGILTTALLVVMALNYAPSTAQKSVIKKHFNEVVLKTAEPLAATENDKNVHKEPIAKEAVPKKISDQLPWPNSEDAYLSEDLAFKNLFLLWGINYAVDGEWPCQFAERHGLFCISKQGSIDTLVRWNRPALLLMKNNEGDEFYFVLKSVSEKTALFELGEKSFYLNLDDIALYWSGRYILLWSPPPGYQGSIRPGRQGQDVAWLARQMRSISGGRFLGGQTDTFDDELVRIVKYFQFENGLISDGIAGKETLIMINSKAGNNVPMLYAND